MPQHGDAAWPGCDRNALRYRAEARSAPSPALLAAAARCCCSAGGRRCSQTPKLDPTGPDPTAPRGSPGSARDAEPLPPRSAKPPGPDLHGVPTAPLRAPVMFLFQTCWFLASKV